MSDLTDELVRQGKFATVEYWRARYNEAMEECGDSYPRRSGACQALIEGMLSYGVRPDRIEDDNV